MPTLILVPFSGVLSDRWSKRDLLRQGQKLEDYPNLQRWFEAIKGRPATIRAYEKADAFNNEQIAPEHARDLLFNQSATTVKR